MLINALKRKFLENLVKLFLFLKRKLSWPLVELYLWRFSVPAMVYSISILSIP